MLHSVFQKKITAFSLIIVCSFAACGGGSGGSVTSNPNTSARMGEVGQMIDIQEPFEGNSFRAGEVISFSLRTENFDLAPPFDRRRVSSVDVRAHHVDPDAVDVDALGDAVQDAGLGTNADEEHGHSGEQPHSHSDETDSHEHDSANAETHGDDGHSHGASMSEASRQATEGHYHVYLNDAEGSDPHITSWSDTLDYELSSDIPVGTHSLRFELRDNNHVIVGAETIYFFDVIP